MTQHAHEPSVSEQFSDYWTTAASNELPHAVRELCKRLLLDTFVVGLRGFESEDVRATANGSFRAFGNEEGPSTVWGDVSRRPPAVAALINGTATHAFEFDDFGGCGHSSAVVVPAVCAIADEVGAAGSSVLHALAAGYDLAARVTSAVGGYRVHNERGWHSTATCGTFGAAAGAAAMLQLDADKFAFALGIAGSHAAGTWSFLADGAATKRLHPGRAASNGVTCAYLAQSGLTGPRYVMEASWGGFLQTYGGAEVDPEAIVDRLGEDFGVATAGIKPFPCCRGLHSSIEALLGIMAEAMIGADAIERIIVHGSERTLRQFAKRHVATVLDGQFSLPYALANVALKGRATLDEFVPLRIADAALAEMMERIDVRADRDLGPYDEPDIEVRLRSGETLAKHIPIAKGAAARPLSDDELARKHETIALPLLGYAKFGELRERLADLENARDFREITRLLCVAR